MVIRFIFPIMLIVNNGNYRIVTKNAQITSSWHSNMATTSHMWQVLKIHLNDIFSNFETKSCCIVQCGLRFKIFSLLSTGVGGITSCQTCLFKYKPNKNFKLFLWDWPHPRCIIATVARGSVCYRTEMGISIITENGSVARADLED